MVTPKILRRRFEIFFKDHFGQISRTLSVYPVMSYTSSFFQMCRDGDILGVQAAVSEGGMTPFLLSEGGLTALHVCRRMRRCKSVMVLTPYSGLHKEPPPNYVPGYLTWVWIRIVGQTTVSKYTLSLIKAYADTVRRKAIDGLGKSRNCLWNGRNNALYDGQMLGTDALVDTLRILGQAQKEVSALDMQDLWYLFSGPARDVELLYRQWSGFIELQEEDSQLACSHILTKALWEYGQGRLEWEYLIRQMILKGVDLHGRVCHACSDEPNERCLGGEKERRSTRKDRRSTHGTPLDELFKETVSPYGAETAAQNWLSILRSEGVDVVAYLANEFASHATQQQLTYSGGDGTTRRQLVFNFGANPTVWWEWLLDPESGAYLAREEFKGMYTLWDDHESIGPLTDPVRDISPFDYPDWSFERMPIVREMKDVPLEYVHRMHDAKDRLDRRWKKKASKLARARRTKGPRKIPGAWPT